MRLERSLKKSFKSCTSSLNLRKTANEKTLSSDYGSEGVGLEKMISEQFTLERLPQ